VQLNVPPVVPYIVGAVLVLFGSLRIRYLAAPRAPRPSEDDDGSADVAPVRGKEQKRHLRMGVVWILLGLFLLVSTYLQVRRGR
jgi:predicted nucleic acid-binding Zn ribbon protein